MCATRHRDKSIERRCIAVGVRNGEEMGWGKSRDERNGMRPVGPCRVDAGIRAGLIDKRLRVSRQEAGATATVHTGDASTLYVVSIM